MEYALSSLELLEGKVRALSSLEKTCFENFGRKEDISGNQFNYSCLLKYTSSINAKLISFCKLNFSLLSLSNIIVL